MFFFYQLSFIHELLFTGLFPSKNAIAFNKMIFNTIKFFEEYLIYGIKDKNKET